MRHPPEYEYQGGWRRFYVERGSGPRAVLFLHGIPTNHRLWDRVIDHLGSEMRAIVPDLTGFGLSDLPADADLSPASQADAIVTFLDRLGVDAYTIVAHDYGFLVGCALLERSPERVEGFVITNTSLRRSDWGGGAVNPLRLLRVPVLGEIAFKLARRWMLELAFRPFLARREKLTADLLDAFWKPFEHGFADTLLRLFRTRSIDKLSELRWRTALSAYSGPVALVWGSQDPVFGVDRAADIASVLPEAETLVLENSNHFVPIDRPRTLARAVNSLVAAGRE